MPSANSLSLNNVAFLGSVGTAVGYVRTAFLNSAASGPGTLNNPADPFNSVGYALAVLNATYPNENVTVVLQSSIDLFNTTDWFLYSTTGSLTVKSNNSGPWTITSFTNNSSENVDIRLQNLTVTTLSWANNNTTTARNAGTITGTSAVIGTLNINGDGPSPTGSMGTSGGTSNGTNGAPGMDGAPPFGGENGGDAHTYGGTGGSAYGNAAWNITLLGNGTITQLNGYGVNATGGAGGEGGIASGGNGGNGGNAQSNENGDIMDGGSGGTGGNAYSFGGTGGEGVGGAGAQVVKSVGWTITASNIAGGIGTGGAGGAAGSATPGNGGSGGSGVNGGSTGSNGIIGSAAAYEGTPGASTNGTAGAITTI